MKTTISQLHCQLCGLEMRQSAQSFLVPVHFECMEYEQARADYETDQRAVLEKSQ